MKKVIYSLLAFVLTFPSLALAAEDCIDRLTFKAFECQVDNGVTTETYCMYTGARETGASGDSMIAFINNDSYAFEMRCGCASGGRPGVDSGENQFRFAKKKRFSCSTSGPQIGDAGSNAIYAFSGKATNKGVKRGQLIGVDQGYQGGDGDGYIAEAGATGFFNSGVQCIALDNQSISPCAE